MEAKICGVKDQRTLNYIINHNYPPKFVGFICNYKKSKRYVNFKKLRDKSYGDSRISIFKKGEVVSND